MAANYWDGGTTTGASYATRATDPEWAKYLAQNGVRTEDQNSEAIYKGYNRSHGAAPLPGPTAPPVGEPDIGTPPTEPGAAAGGLPAAGVAIPEPTAPTLSGYGSAGNAPQMGASAGAQQIVGPDSANPSLGRRIYPQGIRQLAALSPRIY